MQHARRVPGSVSLCRGLQCLRYVDISLAIVNDGGQGELLGQPQMPFQRGALTTRRRVLAIVVEARFADSNRFSCPRKRGNGLEVRV